MRFTVGTVKGRQAMCRIHFILKFSQPWTLKPLKNYMPIPQASFIQRNKSCFRHGRIENVATTVLQTTRVANHGTIGLLLGLAFRRQQRMFQHRSVLQYADPSPVGSMCPVPRSTCTLHVT